MAPKVITVLNQKGGPGKTTVVATLAAALADAHLNVLAVDADSQKTLIRWSEAADEASERGSGQSFPFTVTATVDPTFLRRLPTTDFDAVLIDMPGSFELQRDLLEAVTDVSDLAIIPVELDANAVEPLLRTIKGVLAPKGVPYRCLLNKIDMREGPSAPHNAASSLDGAGLARFRTHIRHYKAYKQATNARQIVTQISNGNADKASEDFSKLAVEMLGTWDTITAKGA